MAGGGWAPYSWWWVDTLAMNVPQWVGLGAMLGREDFIAAATQQYGYTRNGGSGSHQPGLWDADHGLWWRDASFVNDTSPNGAPVFWGRGNAWAAMMAAKTLSLGVLPTGHPLRADLEATLTAQATALIPAQGVDGLWRANLLDPAAYPAPEASATGGIVYALAWGLRSGLLASVPGIQTAVQAGWAGLTTVAQQPDGSIGWCQPVGDAPAPTTINDTSDFCTGMFLLAGTEVWQLAQTREQVHSLSAATSPAAHMHLSAVPPFNFTDFEMSILPQWLARFAVPSKGVGAYSFVRETGVPSLYGSADVAHVLSVVQQLNLSTTELALWAAQIDSFENATGFYQLQPVESSAGYEPWHASGWAMSALRVLGGSSPKYPPAFAQSIALADDPAVWNATFWPLLTDPAGVWSRSHKIAAIPTTLMMTDAAWNTTYAQFFSWLWQLLDETASPRWGYWCLPPNPQPPACMCLGGAFHIGFTLACGQQSIPQPAAVLNTTLALQNVDTGLWGGDSVPGYMDQDGVYMTTRSSVQLGRARWDEVEAMCTAYVRAAARVLNNATYMLAPGSAYGQTAHNLAGVVTPVAECARWFPGLVTTVRPWVNTVDVGCFG